MNWMWVKLTESEFEQCIAPVPLTDDWVLMPFEEARKITNNREWQTIDNPDFPDKSAQKRIIVPKVPPAPTPEEIEAAKNEAIRKAIRAVYSECDEIRLMNGALEAMAAGEKPPQEYLDYRVKIKEIEAGLAKA